MFCLRRKEFKKHGWKGKNLTTLRRHHTNIFFTSKDIFKEMWDRNPSTSTLNSMYKEKKRRMP